MIPKCTIMLNQESKVIREENLQGKAQVQGKHKMTLFIPKGTLLN